MSHAHQHGTDSTLTLAPSDLAAFQRGSLFFKIDRPRQIDPYIDYFGGVGPSAPVPRLEIERAG